MGTPDIKNNQEEAVLTSLTKIIIESTNEYEILEDKISSLKVGLPKYSKFNYLGGRDRAFLE